jgi:hypothetical protein
MTTEKKEQNKSSNPFNFDRTNANDCLNIPIAVLQYHRNTLFSSWQTLEIQQAQTTDPAVHTFLNQINETFFNAWVQFGRV